MPLLYGEGEKAFSRLQEEIIRKTDDETIFAWRGGGESLLAPSPKSFVDCQDFQPLNFGNGFDRPPYSITNRGLEFQCELIEQKWERAQKKHGDMKHHNLLPLRIMRAGLVCALAVVGNSPSVGRGESRLRRADTNAIYECSWDGSDLASIATIIRIIASQNRMEDPPILMEDGYFTCEDVTNDYWLPHASDCSSNLVRQLLYLSLNEPLDLPSNFKVPKDGTAISVAGSEDKHATNERNVSNAKSLGIPVPIRPQSTHRAGGQYEQRQRGISEPIHIPTPKERRAKLERTEDGHRRHVLPKARDVLIRRTPSGKRERQPYG